MIVIAQTWTVLVVGLKSLEDRFMKPYKYTNMMTLNKWKKFVKNYDMIQACLIAIQESDTKTIIKQQSK